MRDKIQRLLSALFSESLLCCGAHSFTIKSRCLFFPAHHTRSHPLPLPNTTVWLASGQRHGVKPVVVSPVYMCSTHTRSHSTTHAHTHTHTHTHTQETTTGLHAWSRTEWTVTSLCFNNSSLIHLPVSTASPVALH